MEKKYTIAWLNNSIFDEVEPYAGDSRQDGIISFLGSVQELPVQITIEQDDGYMVEYMIVHEFTCLPKDIKKCIASILDEISEHIEVFQVNDSDDNVVMTEQEFYNE